MAHHTITVMYHLLSDEELQVKLSAAFKDGVQSGQVFKTDSLLALEERVARLEDRSDARTATDALAKAVEENERLRKELAEALNARDELFEKQRENIQARQRLANELAEAKDCLRRTELALEDSRKATLSAFDRGHRLGLKQVVDHANASAALFLSARGLAHELSSFFPVAR